MGMAVLVTGMMGLAILFGIGLGRGAEVTAGALEGATGAVTLCISMAGVVCLWSGVMEVMRRSGLAQSMAKLLRPILRRLYPGAEVETLENISANVSANLLGLGHAATPLGLAAARGLGKDSRGVATDQLCTLIVCNTASIQLIPTTVAAVRSGLGSASPFDILPAVWLASTISVTVGLTACQILKRFYRS